MPHNYMPTGQTETRSHVVFYEYRCPDCNSHRWSKYASPKYVHHRCPATPEEAAARAKQEAEITAGAERLGITSEHIANYAKALWRWIKAGFPVRSDDEVAAIYAEHCEPCDELVEGRCRRCGCGVGPEGMAAMNKIRMATENCLDKKW